MLHILSTVSLFVYVKLINSTVWDLTIECLTNNTINNKRERAELYLGLCYAINMTRVPLLSFCMEHYPKAAAFVIFYLWSPQFNLKNTILYNCI